LIGFENLFEAGVLNGDVEVHDAGDDVGDPGEPEFTATEPVDGDLIGGVEDGGEGAAHGAGMACEIECGETGGVGLFELEGANPREIGGDAVVGGTSRIREGVLDGEAHIRGGELGEDGAIDEFDHRMDDALGVDDDLDAVHADVEEPAGLNHFEAFVEERGGVDGDLASHDPGGVFEGLFECDGFEGLAGPAGGVAEGAAAGGEPEVADGGGWLSIEALEDGGMFAVHREHTDTAPARLVHHDFTGHDEDFLGSDGDVLAGTDGGEGRGEAGGADDGDEDDVGLGQGGQFEEAFGTGGDADAGELCGEGGNLG